MMIKCEKHGFYQAAQVSPDLKVRVNTLHRLDNFISIHYEYNNEIVDTFFLSKDYAAKYHLQRKNILPLPDDYPEWVTSLALICEKCFEESIE